MAYCWSVTRTDGLVLGFTNHDMDIVIDGIVYEASTGFSASQIQQSLGLAVDNLEATGALSSAAITEVDIICGRYDDAEILLMWVDWQNPTDLVVVSRGNIGTIKREKRAFTVELQSLSHRMQQPIGYLYGRTCTARLGDFRCKKDITGVAFRGPGVIQTGGITRTLQVSGLSLYTNDWFTAGIMEVNSGANVGLDFEIKTHYKTSGVDFVELWVPPGLAFVSGDTAVFVAGCKKDSNTCFVKFNNIVNFRGFNLIPGTDSVTRYPTSSSDKSGGSLFDGSNN